MKRLFTWAMVGVLSMALGGGDILAASKGGGGTRSGGHSSASRPSAPRSSGGASRPSGGGSRSSGKSSSGGGGRSSAPAASRSRPSGGSGGGRSTKSSAPSGSRGRSTAGRSNGSARSGGKTSASRPGGNKGSSAARSGGKKSSASRSGGNKGSSSSRAQSGSAGRSTTKGKQGNTSAKRSTTGGSRQSGVTGRSGSRSNAPGSQRGTQARRNPSGTGRSGPATASMNRSQGRPPNPHGITLKGVALRPANPARGFSPAVNTAIANNRQDALNKINSMLPQQGQTDPSSSGPWEVTKGSLSDFTSKQDTVVARFATQEAAQAYAQRMEESLHGDETYKWTFIVSRHDPAPKDTLADATKQPDKKASDVAKTKPSDVPHRSTPAATKPTDFTANTYNPPANLTPPPSFSSPSPTSGGFSLSSPNPTPSASGASNTSRPGASRPTLTSRRGEQANRYEPGPIFKSFEGAQEAADAWEKGRKIQRDAQLARLNEERDLARKIIREQREAGTMSEAQARAAERSVDRGINTRMQQVEEAAEKLKSLEKWKNPLLLVDAALRLYETYEKVKAAPPGEKRKVALQQVIGQAAGLVAGSFTAASAAGALAAGTAGYGTPVAIGVGMGIGAVVDDVTKDVTAWAVGKVYDAFP
jgi:hypothetical protein